jgi:transcriptional regulator with XRE-family HTH domain
MTLGEYTKYIRKSKKIKLVKMASDLGVTASSISRWENNKTSPSLTTVENMVNYVGYRVIIVDKLILPV